ncbi:mRNA-decapping enzyme 1B [Chrysoperla carnea]|uniref:mRNA-decapping enzyme 1B n=1 Tax=Chrysoperla carnea TaxID=189513 RepID=UPI001D075B91|nr:mRNA-decapping enzyme 1B [Chrysoperla carnea]
MADISELRMNVTALKRVDPYVKDIIDTASHVALYSFNREENKWEKTEIEGALFVYNRNGQPQNSIIIMNRLNTNNLVEPVVQKLDLQLQAPFLLYRNSRFRIYGIWFYDKEECVRIASLLEKLIEEVPRIETKTMSTPQQGVDIFGMLTKAQEDFKNSSTKPVPPDVTSQSVMDFFAKASGGTGKSEPLFQQIFNNPAHSVEHIEKQVRAATPADAVEDSVQASVNLIESGVARLQTSPEQPLTPSIRQNSTAPALMPPTMFTTVASAVTNRSSVDPPPEPLTRNQFHQAFIYMLRNDPDFVTKLHEAYVKSFSELVS